VLRGVYMQASPGEITGLAGESGSGKTTLVDLLVRILELRSLDQVRMVVLQVWLCKRYTFRVLSMQTARRQSTMSELLPL
jgi:ABC-type multidrug transport system ATPase subunit